MTTQTIIEAPIERKSFLDILQYRRHRALERSQEAFKILIQTNGNEKLNARLIYNNAELEWDLLTEVIDEYFDYLESDFARR